MADEENLPGLRSAIDVVARMIAWRISDPERALWEEYPDIGEHDWERIMKVVENLIGEPPDLAEFKDSIEYLSQRADR